MLGRALEPLQLRAALLPAEGRAVVEQHGGDGEERGERGQAQRAPDKP